MFWDGERWVPEKGPVIRSKRPTSGNRLRRWLVAVPILFLVTALVIPVVSTEAANYQTRVVVSGVAEPGGLVTLTGSGSRPGGYLQARLDRASTRLGLIRVDRRGAFRVQLRLPSTTTPGTHLVTIGRVSYGGLATASIRSTRLLAQTTILSVKVNVKRKGGVSKAAPPSPTPVPAPVPTPVPAPAASAAPNATPPPTPTPTPTPAATPTPSPSGIPVPASIDASGATDTSAALNAWLLTVPDGSTIVFPAGGVYRLNASLSISARNNLTFEGNGATLQSRGGSDLAGSTFAIWHSNHIVIRNLVVAGNSSSPGVYLPGQESAHGLRIVGGSSIEIGPNVTVRNSYGDGISIDYWTDGVWMHDSADVGTSRNGIAILAGTHLTIERNTFDRNGGGVFDAEPYQDGGGATFVKFLNNTSGTHTYGFFDANGNTPNAILHDIECSGNRVTAGTLTANLTNITAVRRSNIIFTNNTGTVPTAGPLLRFAHVDGLTVTGNVQPLTSGVLTSIVDSTGVTDR